MYDCRTCGACCKGLLVTLEIVGDEVVPPWMTRDDRFFGPVMRERNGRCIALSGEIGKQVRCRIYENRPQVCKDFAPGCSYCEDARKRHLFGAQMVPTCP